MNKFFSVFIIIAGIFSIFLSSSSIQKIQTSEEKIEVLNQFDGIAKATKPKKKSHSNS